MQVRGLVRTAVAAGIVWGVLTAGGGPALAQAPTASPAATPALQPIGANQIMKLTTDAGFIDEVLAYDNQRVAYVVADTATKAELHVVQLGCAKCIEAKQEVIVDLSAITLRPTALKLVGQRAFVIGQAPDGTQVAALVDLAKKKATPIYKLGPATHITLITRDKTTRVAVDKTSTTKSGVRHDVQIHALETGRRVAAGRPFEITVADRKEPNTGDNAKLDFHVNHWADGFTLATGVKGGVWTRTDNTRGPDTEATYDLVSGKFVENKPIGDLVEQRKRFQQLADANGDVDFARMSWDNANIQLWMRGTARTVELDQPISTYAPKSLQAVVARDGSAWLALNVDPVNADAVARKKADTEYLDIFRIDAGSTKAVRRARIPSKNVRFKFGMVDDKIWLLERSNTFDRGGRGITIYSFAQ